MGRGLRPDRRRAEGPRRPRPRRSSTRRVAPATRPRSSTSCSCGRFGTNNLPDCSNMCHESSGAALGETLGIGKGTVTLDDIDHADLIIVVGQNPGTNHPRMLTALETAKANGAPDRRHQPAARGRAAAGSATRRRPHGVLGGGTELADRYLQIRVNGDLALFQAVGAPPAGGGRDAAPPATPCSTTTSSTSTPTASTRYAEHVADLDWDAVLAATGLDPRRGRGAGRTRCWPPTGSSSAGRWASPSTATRWPPSGRSSTSCCCGATSADPGAGACPVRGHSNVQGDRTMGIYEKPAPAFLDALERRVRLRAAPRTTATTPWTPSGRCATARRRRVRRPWAATSSPAAPDTDVTAEALRTLPAHGARLDQAQPVAHRCRARSSLILPCLGRTERDDAGRRRRRSSRVEDSMGMVHASRAAWSRRPPHLPQRGRDRRRGRPAGAGRRVTGRLAGAGRRLRSSSASHIAPGRPRASTTHERRLRRARWLRPAQPARDSRTLPDRDRPGPLHGEPAGGADRAGGPAAAADHPQPRPVQHHDLRARRPLPGHHAAGGGCVFAHADDLAELGFADGEVVDVVSEWHDGERRAEGFRLVAYPVAQGTCAAYFPEANVLVPLDSHGRGQRHPDLEVGHRPPRAPRALSRRSGAAGRPTGAAVSGRFTGAVDDRRTADPEVRPCPSPPPHPTPRRSRGPPRRSRRRRSRRRTGRTPCRRGVVPEWTRRRSIRGRSSGPRSGCRCSAAGPFRTSTSTTLPAPRPSAPSPRPSSGSPRGRRVSTAAPATSRR